MDRATYLNEIVAAYQAEVWRRGYLLDACRARDQRGRARNLEDTNTTRINDASTADTFDRAAWTQHGSR